MFQKKSTSTKAKQSEKNSREATEDELKCELTSSNEINLFEICGDSVIYHNGDRIIVYTKHVFKNFNWSIVKSSVAINGVMHHYNLQNGNMGSISIYFYTKESAENYLKTILQFSLLL